MGFTEDMVLKAIQENSNYSTNCFLLICLCCRLFYIP
uniref:Uncharacterized protein n=1 Tax=Arundo donax TaxID=35708 RepID=A0A0A9FW46_ARUDO